MTPDEIEQLAAALAPMVAEQLKQSPPTWEGLDWSQLNLAEVPKNRRVQSSQLDPLIFALCKAIAYKSYDDSMGRLVQTALEMYLRATFAKHLASFQAIAVAQGITLEQAIQRAYEGSLPL